MPLSASAALRLGASGGCVRRVRGSGVRAGFYFGGSGFARLSFAALACSLSRCRSNWFPPVAPLSVGRALFGVSRP